MILTSAALLALFGLGDAVYLTTEHLSGRTAKCTFASGCSEVLSSRYAVVGKIPLAALGALAYFTVFSAATLAAFGYRGARPVLSAVTAVMCATTLWLLYLQAFVIGHFCDYCLFSAAMTLGLTGLVIAERIRADSGPSS